MKIPGHAFLMALVAAITASCATGIEQPDYEVIREDGGFELRKYPALPLVSTPMDGMDRRNQGFGRLFRYISGDNETDRKIAMTAPVIMETGPEDVADAGSGAMSFVIPADVAADGAPAPKAGDVEVRTMPARHVATLRFGGWRSEDRRREAAARLKTWAAEQGLEADGEPFFAFYDPPWKPEFMRRNEVWLAVGDP